MGRTAASTVISNPDKLMFPAAGFTKADVVAYYLEAAPYLLPHLKGRPVTLKRYPDGVGGKFFYEKDAPSFTPAWVKRFHSVVFDLDPGPGTDVLTCADVAFLLKDVLDRLSLQAFAKVSGSKGIQVHVPLNTAITYAVTQPFARTVAEFLARDHPRLVTAGMAKSERSGRVFIDWSQNAQDKTTVAAYSLRAKRARPFVSMPVTWEELREAAKARNPQRLDFEPKAALARLARLGDLYRPVLTLKQGLPAQFTSGIAATRGRGRLRRLDRRKPSPSV